MSVVTISQFIETKYRDFWKQSNINRNTFLPHEQLMTIERRIIWSAFKIGMGNLNNVFKMNELAGEVAKYHVAGDSSIYDSIKGLATNYKRQPAARIIKGIGNVGSGPGDPGAAPRYLSVSGTPLLQAIIKDLPFVPYVVDEEGVKEPKYVSTPIPMVLVNGKISIGTGRAAYVDERDPYEVIDWIEALSQGLEVEPPAPISSTGCITYKRENGYTYYDAVIHKERRKDVITALPPQVTPESVITALKKKHPSLAKYDMDGSGKGRPVWIEVPSGYISEDTLTKYNLRTARKEAPYVWDEELDTMRLATLEELAISWFEDRKAVVAKRIESEIAKLQKEAHKIAVVRRYVEEKLGEKSVDEIYAALGSEDAEMVLNQPAKAFLPSSIEKGKEREAEIAEEVAVEKARLEDVGKVVLDEARAVVAKQNEFDWDTGD